MISVLIVDDEEVIRKGLMKIIARSCRDFEVVGEAGNGREALDFIGKNPPDVVITDIKMPRMDGIELIRNLELEFPAVRAIVLSGFDEFNFVRDTMRRGALDYLLKPVDEDQLSALFSKIMADISEERDRKLLEQDMRMKLNESFPLLRERSVRELICERDYPEEEIECRLTKAGIAVPPGIYRVLIVSLDNCGLLFERIGAVAARSKVVAVGTAVEKSFGKPEDFLTCFTGHDLVIAVSLQENDPSRFSGLLDALHTNLKQAAGARFSIGVGTEVRSLADLKDSYRAALENLRYRLYCETSSILTSDHRCGEKSDGRSADAFERFETRLRRCVELAEFQDVRKAVAGFCADLHRDRPEPREVRTFLAETFVRLQAAFPEFGKAAGRLYGPGYSFSRELESRDTLDEAGKYLSAVYTDIVREIVEIRSGRDRKLVEVVKEYVASHYAEDITLAVISEVVCLTPGYVSDLFRNRTGETFVDYLTRFRMEKAKALLKDVKVKVFEVGLLVGYEDATYFSKVFKKVVGITPREYRDLVE